VIGEIPEREGGHLATAFAAEARAAEAWLSGRPFGVAARQSLVTWLVRRLIACAHTVLLAGKPLARYPVVLRLLADSPIAWRDACERLLARAAGRSFIADVEVHLGRLGSSLPPAFTLRLEDGTSQVYRPYDVRVAAWFQDVSHALDDAGLDPPLPVRDVEAHEDHAWDRFVPRTACRDHAEVTRYYLRAGMFVRLLEAVKAVDLHALNVVAAGEWPMLVDLEGVLAAEGPVTPLTSSFLPTRFAGEPGLPPVDIGGLHRGGRVVLPYLLPVVQNRRLGFAPDEEIVAPTWPELDGKSVPPPPDVLLDGYRRLDTLLGGLDLAPLAARAAGLRVRRIGRAGPDERRLLHQSLSLDLLADEARRDDWLATQVTAEELPAFRDLRVPRLTKAAAAPDFRPHDPATLATHERLIREALLSGTL
jgi:hypothetical protein